MATATGSSANPPALISIKAESSKQDSSVKFPDQGHEDGIADPCLISSIENGQKDTQQEIKMEIDVTEPEVQNNEGEGQHTRSGKKPRWTKSHNESRYRKCNLCQKSFAGQDRLLIHRMRHHGLGDELENRAQISYSEVEEMLSKIFPYQCNECRIYFRYKELMTEHDKVHEPEPVIVEGIEQGEIIHGKDHHNKIKSSQKRRYKCEICEKDFDKKERYVIHKMNAHQIEDERLGAISESANRCEECGETFPYKRMLVVHQSKEHSKRDKKYPCDICGKEMSSGYKLNLHRIKLHDSLNVKRESSNHHCEQCGKTFHYKHDLNKHLLMHSDQAKQFQCKLCDKIFPDKLAYNRHMQYSHETPSTTDTETVCEICSRSFMNQQLVIFHMTDSHSGAGDEKSNFQCCKCDKAFPKKLALKLHITNVHYLSYPCDMCDQKFRSKVLLDEHHSTVHLGKPLYQCEFCGLRLHTQHTYCIHRTNQHPREYAKLKREHKAKKLPYNRGA
ncbi:zinc finger protein 59-like [Uranotaenia lowii]|uniref:zinc finger protein 59-like n=1 Tax=Uranotaenia lowii TaxID=190385 RepID=UPI00247AE395|nr:zinc finger protein 59-like [Uranotaenia lowii]